MRCTAWFHKSDRPRPHLISLDYFIVCDSSIVENVKAFVFDIYESVFNIIVNILATVLLGLVL